MNGVNFVGAVRTRESVVCLQKTKSFPLIWRQSEKGGIFVLITSVKKSLFQTLILFVANNCFVQFRSNLNKYFVLFFLVNVTLWCKQTKKGQFAIKGNAPNIKFLALSSINFISFLDFLTNSFNLFFSFLEFISIHNKHAIFLQWNRLQLNWIKTVKETLERGRSVSETWGEQSCWMSVFSFQPKNEWMKMNTHTQTHKHTLSHSRRHTQTHTYGNDIIISIRMQR